MMFLANFKMPILRSNDLNKKFDYVLCDSKDALIYCYKNGLNKNISVNNKFIN